MGSDPDSPWMTSIHEAAHGLVAVVLEPLLDLQVIAITGPGEGSFHTRREDSPRGLTAFGVALFAGMEAEHLAGQPERLARRAGRDDMKELRRIFGADKWALERARNRATLLLAQRMDDVELVARHLLQRRQLTGEQVRAILRGTGKQLRRGRHGRI